MQSSAITSNYHQPIPEKEVDRLKENSKLRTSPPTTKIYEVLTEAPTHPERQTRSPTQRVAASEVKRSEDSEKAHSVKSKLDDIHQIVSKLKITLRSTTETDDSKEADTKQDQLVQHLEKLKSSYPQSDEQQNEVPDTRFANILSKLNTVIPDQAKLQRLDREEQTRDTRQNIRTEQFREKAEEATSKITENENKTSSSNRTYQANDIADFKNKSLEKTQKHDISLGDLLESLNKNFTNSDDTNSNQSADDFSWSAAEVVTAQKFPIGSFGSQNLENINKEADHIVQNLVSSLSHMPITEIRKGPPSLLDNLLDKALQDIEVSRTKVDTIAKKLPEDNERIKTLAREANVAPYNPREAENIALQIATSTPAATLRVSQYNLTPNAVSQLLF